MRMERYTGPLADTLRHVSMYRTEYLEVGQERIVMPSFYADWHSRYASFPIRQDDTWVVTYPKSGTTWIQEMVWCLINDLKSPEAELELMKRFPFLEIESLISPDIDTTGLREDDPMINGNSWRILKDLPAPRTIKSHLPKELLPKQIWQVKPKVVYVCRDPRDVCVSYYYHYIKLDSYNGTFNQFADLFIADKLTYSPFWSHLLNFWKMRHEEHILFIRYEDMKKDLAAIVRQVAGFLGKEVDEEQVAWLAHHCSFDEMSKNPAVNNETFILAQTEEATKLKFMRKGKVGDWRNHLTEEQQQAFTAWTLKYLEGSDFPYYKDYD